MNEERKVYLMLKGHNSLPDYDSWLGIYENTKRLKYDYVKCYEELKNEQREGRCRDFDIQLYKFELNTYMNGEVERVSPAFLFE